VGGPDDNVGFVMAGNQQEKRKCGRRFKSNTMLVCINHERRKHAYRNTY